MEREREGEGGRERERKRERERSPDEMESVCTPSVVDLSMPFRIRQVRDKIAQETSAVQANYNPTSSPKIPNGAAARAADRRSGRAGGGDGEGDGVGRLKIHALPCHEPSDDGVGRQTIHFDQDVDYSLGPSVSQYTHTQHIIAHTMWCAYVCTCTILHVS